MENKGEEKRCRNCSGRVNARDKLLWELGKERIKKVASILSLIYPGLGHFYSGRYLLGVFWASFIPLSLGLVINTWQGLNWGHLVLFATYGLIWFLAYLDARRGFDERKAPCESACPSHLNVPDYIALVREGDPLAALSLIHEKLPFASICGRICPHPCEQACVRNELGDPIAIAAIKRFAADRAYPKKISPGIGVDEGSGTKKVAIIGGGPAGLSAANTLAILGVKPVVFDEREEPGGTMVSAIPIFRLPKESLRDDIEFILKRGVEFRGRVRVGEDVDFEDILSSGEFDAVLISVGASTPVRLPMAGDESQGFFDALTFLERANRGEKIPVGERVVVVGGGNVAMDVARMALRLGVRDVTIACLEKRQEMPAFPWEIEEALEEGAKLLDGIAVRKFFIMRNRVAGFEALEVDRIEFDREGRINPITVPGTEFEVNCDTVIMAIGSRADMSFVPGKYSLKVVDEIHGVARLIFRDKKYKIPIYVCGDCVKGPSTVVEASASGRYAALNIFARISVEEIRKVKFKDNYARKNEPQVEDSEWLRKRIPMERLRPDEAVRSFDEVEKGYSEVGVRRECERCARCNLFL